MVAIALGIRFVSSSVSIRSEFQISDRSVTFRSDILPATPCIFSTAGQRLVGAEDGGVGLHGLLHLEPQLGRRACRHRRGACRRSGTWRSPSRPRGTSGTALRGRPPRRRGSRRRGRRPRGRSASWSRGGWRRAPRRSRPRRRHQAGHHAVGIALGRVQHLAPVIRRDAAHVVVHRRQHRDRLLRHVDAGEDLRRFRDARQAFGQRLGIGRWFRCRWMWSLFLPTPRPSRISIVMQRETTSREARSL
jgi:hypothetical protein